MSSSVLVANHVADAAGAASLFTPIATEPAPPPSDGPVAFPSPADAAARFLNPETAASTKETSSTKAFSSAAFGMEGGGTTDDGMLDCECVKDEGFDMALIPWYVHSPAAVKARSDPVRKRKKGSLSPFLLLLPISPETRVLLLSVSY